MLVALGLAGGSLSAVQNDSKRTAASSLQERALHFESNHGQYGEGPAFVSRGPNYYLALSPTEVRVTLQKATSFPAADNSRRVARTPGTINYRSLLIELSGANRQAVMFGEGEVAGRANYFIGNEPAKWRTGVPTYERVRVADVYPGINLLHYGNQQHLEYDFEVAPGANPDLITLRFIGADKISIGTDGDLILVLGGEEIRQPKPIIFQRINGQRKEIDGGYVLIDPQTIKFGLGDYDRRLPLVIDPVVSYSSYVPGASGSNDDYLRAVAIGSNGDIFMAGDTLTPGSATTNAYQTNLVGMVGQYSDVFVTRQNNAATAKVYFTYLGGNYYESVSGLAVDSDGNAYVTGYTGSTNFPTSHAIQTNIAGKAPIGFATPAVDCFITKVGPYGSNLVFSTFYGGAGTGYNGVGDDVGFGIAVDASQNVFVAGYTSSTNFPAVNTVYTNAGGAEDGFVLKLDSSGTNVIYAMRLGGANSDLARDITVDLAGEPIVTGYTASTNFPVTTNAFQTLLNGSTNLIAATDAFVSKISATSGALIYSTFLGGTNSDQATRLAVDASGAAYAVGWTLSGNFPRTATNIFSAIVSNTSVADVFVAKLNFSSPNLDYGLTFGGTGKDEGRDIAVDAAGQAHIVGLTESANFPTNALFESLLGYLTGNSDAFVVQINSNGTAFVYAGYFDATDGDGFAVGVSLASGIALDAGGNSYTIGELDPVARNTGKDGFILKILSEDAPISLSIAAAGTNVVLSWPGYVPEFNLESRKNIAGTNVWVSVLPTPVLTNNQLEVTVPATNFTDFFRLKRDF